MKREEQPSRHGMNFVSTQGSKEELRQKEVKDIKERLLEFMGMIKLIVEVRLQ